MVQFRSTRILLLAAIPAIAFVALRCADAPNGPQPPAVVAAPAIPTATDARLAALHDKYDWFGKYHNDALAFVLARLQKLPAKGRNIRETCEAARLAYNEFHRARFGKEVPPGADAAAAQDCAGKKHPRPSLLPEDGSVRADVMSSGGEALINQIVDAVDASYNPAQLDATVAQIEQNALQSLSEDEAGAVVALGSIALSSVDYWQTNYAAWDEYAAGTMYSIAAGSALTGRATALPQGGIASPRLAFYETVKRAARGDAVAGAKAIFFSWAVGPFVYNAILAAAAWGSIAAVLQV